MKLMTLFYFLIHPKFLKVRSFKKKIWVDLKILTHPLLSLSKPHLLQVIVMLFTSLFLRLHARAHWRVCLMACHVENLQMWLKEVRSSHNLCMYANQETKKIYCYTERRNTANEKKITHTSHTESAVGYKKKYNNASNITFWLYTTFFWEDATICNAQLCQKQWRKQDLSPVSRWGTRQRLS